ncbi:MAG: hypothetical protein L6263_12780, partial [Desulfobacteraceae bacterium]|nr:hypothetical protein [Desulfobacteraceae bacterium]
MMDKLTKLNIIAELVNEVKSQTKSVHCLKISMSNFSIFKIKNTGINLVSGVDWANKITTGYEFDLILGNL